MPPHARLVALIALPLAFGGLPGCSTASKSSDIAIWLVKDGTTYEPSSAEYTTLHPQLAGILEHHRRMTGEPFVLSENVRTADYIARVEVEADGTHRIQSLARNPKRAQVRRQLPVTSTPAETHVHRRHPSLELAERNQREAENRPFDSH